MRSNGGRAGLAVVTLASVLSLTGLLAGQELRVDFHGLTTFHVTCTLLRGAGAGWPDDRLDAYVDGDPSQSGRTLLSAHGQTQSLVVNRQPGESGVAIWRYTGAGGWVIALSSPFESAKIKGTPNWELTDTVAIDGGDPGFVVVLANGLAVPAGKTLTVANLTIRNPSYYGTGVTVAGTARFQGCTVDTMSIGGVAVVGAGTLRFEQCKGSLGFGVSTAAGTAAFSQCEFDYVEGGGLAGTVTLEQCRILTPNLSASSTGRLTFTDCEIWVTDGVLGGGEWTLATCRVRGSVFGAGGLGTPFLNFRNLAKLTLYDSIIEPRLTVAAVPDLTVEKCEIYQHWEVDVTGSTAVEIARNVIAGNLTLTGTVGAAPSIWANDFIGQHGFLNNSTGLNLTDANYWGSHAGPAEGVWLHPGGAALGGVALAGMAILTDPAHADDRASSRPEARPFPAIWVADWQLGQNVMGRGYNNPRVGRDTLLVFDVRTAARALPGVSFSLRWNGNLITPEPGFELKRDHGPAPKTAAADTDAASPRLALAFIIPAALTGGDLHTFDLIMDTTAVTGYATPGKVQTLAHRDPLPSSFVARAPARKLNILVVDVYNLTVGYQTLANSAWRLADYLNQAIPALLPIRPEELFVTAGPPYPFFSCWGSLHEIWQPWMLGWLIGELDGYRWFNNGVRALLPAGNGERFDYIVGVVGDSTLGGESGLMLAADRRVALVRCSSLPLALHELGHCWGLYLNGAEQYDRGDGPDGLGNIVDEWTGANGVILEGLTAFNPESYSRLPVGGLTTRIANFPAGVNRGIFDLMANAGRDYWIVPSSVQTAYATLLEVLGTTVPEPVPPEPQVRRLRLSGRFEKNSTWDPPAFRPVSGTISCQLANNLAGSENGAQDLGLRFRAYDRDGNMLVDAPCTYDREYKDGNWTSVVWNQTIDVPATIYSYAIVRASGSKTLYTATDLGSGPGASLRGPPTGDLGSGSTTLNSSGGRADSREASHPLASPAQRQLYYSTDNGGSWIPLGGDLQGDSISIPFGFLPATASLSFKLVATDGFRATESVLTGYWISARPPVLSLESPQAGDAARPGTPWTLSATASSPERETVTVAWTSSRDGALGSLPHLGGVVLSTGTHVLTCTATDAGGRTSTAAVTVTVREDGGPDLQVPPDALTLRRQGLAPEIYCPNRPQIGTACDVTLALRNPGIACRVRVRLYVSPPDARGETLLAEQEVATQPFERFPRLAQYTPPRAGTYAFRATLEALAATDPDPANNTASWTFQNEAPVARGVNAATPAGQACAVPLDGYDADQNPLTYTVITPPAHGVLSGTAPELTYTPDGDVPAVDSFQYQVNDGQLDSAAATVSIAVATAASAEADTAFVRTLVTPAGAGSVGPFLANGVPTRERLPLPIVALPAAGYQFSRWLLGGNGTPVLADPNAASTTVTPNGGTAVVTAVFTAIPTEFAAHFRTNGGGFVSLEATGAAQSALTQMIAVGGDCAPVYALPAAGYGFQHWSGTGYFQSFDNPLTVTHVTEELTLRANFALTGGGLTLTLAAAPVAGGSVLPAGPVTGIAPGQAVDIHATAATGYGFSGWSATPTSAQFAAVTNPDTTVRITAPTTVTAHFAPLQVVVAFRAAGSALREGDGTLIEVVLGSASLGVVTVNYAVAGGSATAGVDYLLTPGTLTFQPGETAKTIPLTVLADGVAESEEAGMIALSGPVNAVLGTPAGHRFTIGDTPPGMLSVVFLAAAHGSLSGMAMQMVASGANTSPVRALADPGYEFDRWDDSSAANRDNPRVVRNVTSAMVLTALFRPTPAVVAPAGPFEATVDAAGVAAGRGLWDLTGTYTATVSGNPLMLNMIHDCAGRLTGTATYQVGKAVGLTMPIKGRVQGSSGSITMAGTLKGADRAQAVDVAFRLDLTVDPANRRLVGPLTGNIRNGALSTPVSVGLTLPIPAPMDGTWTLHFQLGQAGRRVTGTALLALSNGVDCAFVVQGRTNQAGAVLNLTGVPTDPLAKGTMIRTTITPLEGACARLESLSGRGYGQTLGW